MELNRRNFTKLTTALMATPLLAKEPIEAYSSEVEFKKKFSKAETKKNVIFIVAEDMKLLMGCYGNPLVKTPNFDCFAKKSVVFKNAFCQAPICNPSRTSFITGLRPDTTGISDNSVAWHENVPDAVTLPYFFRQNGYYTARAGKLFHHQIKDDDKKAWDKILMVDNWTDSKEVESVNFTNDLIDWALYSIVDGPDSNEPDYKIAQFGIDFLRQRPKDKPFFLNVGFFRPHGPWQVPRKYYDMYDIDEFVSPFTPTNNEFQHELTFTNEYSSDWKDKLEEGLTEESKREFMRAYYACVSFVDAQFGRLIDEIGSQELWENTTIVFFSDHGYHLGENDWWNKNTLFDASARVPLIVYDPDFVKNGAVAEGFIELVDLYPTLADLCELEVPRSLEGISFKKLLEDPGEKWKKCVYTQVKHKYIGRSVRTQRWRYIRWDNGTEELYDYLSDPCECKNLINVKYLRKVVLKMKELLKNGCNVMEAQNE